MMHGEMGVRHGESSSVRRGIRWSSVPNFNGNACCCEIGQKFHLAPKSILNQLMALD